MPQINQRPIRLTPARRDAKLLFTFGVLFVAILGIPGLTFALVTEQAILVRGDHSYPPYEYLNRKDQPEGFNIDIMRAVATVMGLKIRIELGPWQEVRAELERGQIDVLMGMFNTRERDKRVDFSIPHFITSYAVFVPKGSAIQSLDDVRRKRIIVQSADLGHDYVKENRLSQKILTFTEWEETLKALSQGRGDCAIVARLQGIRIIQELGLTNVEAVGPPIIQRKYCLAVVEGNSSLLAKLNEGLSIIKSNGTYNEIYEKWFGVMEKEPLTLSDALKYLRWIVTPVLVLAFAGFLWSWTLKKQVAAKTEAQRRELQDRKQAELALQKSEERFRSLVEITADFVWEVDSRDRYTYVSPNIEDLLGYTPEEIIGKTRFDLMPTAEARKVAREYETHVKRKKPFKALKNTTIHKNGQRIVLATSGAPILDERGNLLGYRGVDTNITEQLQIELRLQQAHKMEAIGTLAGGIAHDFNNILGAIIGYTELAQDNLNDGLPAERYLGQILKSSLRARDLVQQILTFSRRRQEEPRPILVQPIVKEVVKLLRSTIPSTVDIRLNIKGSIGMANADATQIHQVIMNLCTNAAYAMREAGGNLELGLRVVSLDEATARQYLEIDPGPYIELSVMDSGHGIQADIIQRIFEPFFTTKAKSKGTGMGLAVVHGIIKGHGGDIGVSSRPGKGTTFTVLLPRIEAVGETSTASHHELPTGNERILLIDDEEALLATGGKMLASLGYGVEARKDSLQALETFRREPARYDLVVTDQTMPNMTGDRLARELLAIKPGLPVIICTGFSERINRAKAEAEGIKGFLMKPVTKADLAHMVRQVLDHSGA